MNGQFNLLKSKSIQSNTLCIGFYQNPLMGDLAIFSTGTYAIIGTTCVKSETCYEKYHENKKKVDIQTI